MCMHEVLIEAISRFMPVITEEMLLLSLMDELQHGCTTGGDVHWNDSLIT